MNLKCRAAIAGRSLACAKELANGRAALLPVAEARHMPHFSPRTRFALVVEMKVAAATRPLVRPTVRRRGRSDFPSLPRRNQRRIAEGKAEYGAQVLLELRGMGALDRPVAAIVDARRHFVDHRPSAQAKNSTVSTPTWSERIGDGPGPGDGLRRLCVDLRSGRHGRGAQYATLMMVARSAERRWLRPPPSRARMTLNSASKSILASATAGWRPIASQAAAASPGR